MQPFDAEDYAMTMVPIEVQIKPFIFLILFISFLSLNIIYSKTNENLGNKREIHAFKGMLVSFMVYILEDLRLLFGDSFYSALPRPVVLFIMSTGFTSMSFACFFWFLHVRANLNRPSNFTKIYSLNFWSVLIHIPLFLVLILLYTPLHVFVYELSGNGPVFKPMLSFILLMDYVYLIAATGISIHNRRLAKTRHEKKKYNSQIIFILFFTINGILIAFLLNLPAIELCIIPVVLKLFVELQDSQIYTDALTKLYNRRRMADIINEELATCSADDPLTIIMVDLDYFKSINDILGHDEGDKALVAISKAMRKILLPRNAVAARWGGDEFVIAGKDAELASEFRNLLSNALEDDKTLSYTPIFSTGTYICTSPATPFEQALSNADSALYKDKEERHKTFGDFITRLNEIKKGS